MSLRSARNSISAARCSSRRPPPPSMRPSASEHVKLRHDRDRSRSRQRSFLCSLPVVDGWSWRNDGRGRRIKCCSDSLGGNRIAQVSSRHAKGHRGQGRRRQAGGGRGRRRRRVGAQSEWADLLLCSLVAPPSLDRLAPDDDVLGLHSSAATVLSLSLGRQEFHLAVQLIQYSAAHNEAAR